MKTTQTGKVTEQACCDYLVARGLKLVEKNYRCRFGEIDLVMQHRKQLVFVEVRFRKNRRYGGALESIDNRKQRKIMLTVQHYLLSQQPHQPVRIDVVGMHPASDGVGGYEFEWIQDAIQAG